MGILLRLTPILIGSLIGVVIGNLIMLFIYKIFWRKK